jgi:vacuolar iron transporter family protein
LGLSPDLGAAALGDAVVVGGTYLLAAIIPLWPYFFMALHSALWVSIACTLVALAGVGIAKARVARMAWLPSAIQVVVIGSLSAGLGYLIGHLVSGWAG